jgi:hypothetical protein
VDLDGVGDRLYGLPPEEFTAARKEQETAARRAGDRDLAREIAALGKPSTAAWVCNLLVRRAPEEVAGLLELGDLLREAQESLAGNQLRELDVQRRRLLGALVRQARSLAAEEGHRVSEAVAGQVEETLRAALADPDAGEALRSGRLTSVMSYSGLGTGGRPDLRVVRSRAPAAPAEPARPAARTRSAAGRPSADERREQERRAAEERRQRELAAARAAAEDADAAAEEAQDAARTEREHADRLSADQEDRQRRLDELAEELDRLRGEVTRGESELERVQRRARSAQRRAAEAAAERDRARARVEELQADPPG